MDSNLWSYLRLLQIKGLGTQGARKLLECFENPSQIFEEKNRAKIQEILGGNISIFKQIIHLSNEEEIAIKQEIQFMEKNDILYIGIIDEEYPYLLKQCFDAPVILFYRGMMECWSDKSVAIVGTRKATSYGLNFTQQFIESIKEYQPLIVSGLALGIDIKSHLVALENGLNTVAVLGMSFQSIYPKKHTSYSKMIEQQGLLITEYPSWTKPIPEHFVRRNRIIAGLSQATVVVQSAKKGGSLTTALYANEYNREVFAVPGRVDDILSEGCMWLIQENRAQLLLDATDVIEDLNWSNQVKSHEKLPKSIDMSLCSIKEKRILELFLIKEKMHIDEISLETGIEMNQINGLLMMLEINGYIKSYPGKLFGI